MRIYRATQGNQVFECQLADGQRGRDIVIDNVLVGVEAVNIALEEIMAQRETAVVEICALAKEIIETEINPFGGFKLKDLAAAGKVRALETITWIDTKYMAVEVRKAQVYAGMWDDDLSSATNLAFIGKKPWTIAQIFAE